MCTRTNHLRLIAIVACFLFIFGCADIALAQTSTYSSRGLRFLAGKAVRCQLSTGVIRRTSLGRCWKLAGSWYGSWVRSSKFWARASKFGPWRGPQDLAGFSPPLNPAAKPSATQSVSPRPTPTVALAPAPPPVVNSAPDLPLAALYESNMLSFGRRHCEMLKSGSVDYDTKLAGTYYDAILVYYGIYDHTGDSYWLSCVAAAKTIQRDSYVLGSNGAVPGYWNFTQGLAQDYLRTGDAASRRALLLLAQNAAFARDSTQEWETVDDLLRRETAYSILAYLMAEDVGEPRRSRLSLLINHALGHLDQWFVLRNADYVRPFMFSLTAYALLQAYERTGDSRILPALKRGADWIWTNTWIPAAEAFMYTDRWTSSGGQEATPDLNLLIAPVYAGLYYHTGEVRFLERADAIFAGGVKQAYLTGAKQFNQNYRLWADLKRWRGGK